MAHGGARRNAGRPQEKVKIGKPGTPWIILQDGVDRVYHIVSVSDDQIEFQDAETEAIIVLRKPDD